GMQGFYVWAWFLWKMVLPLNLSPLYTNLLKVDPAGATFVLSLLLIVAVSVWFVWRRKRWPGALAAWVAYLVILVPMLGLTEHPHFPSDRYSLLPAIAISVGISLALLKFSASTWKWR